MEEKTVGCARPITKINKEPQKQNEEIQLKEKIMEIVRVGHKAPDFEAPSYYKGGFSSVKLSDYKGKWVVLCFYPGDFTFVWATEVSAVAANYDKLHALDTEVISMSVDSQFVHKVWNDQELKKMAKRDVPFHMASDGAGHVGKMYGVYDEEAGVEFRGRFIIDPDGVVQAMEILTPPVGRKLEETMRQIRAFQHVRKTKGAEVCPAGWDTGKKVLKPGPELVGNVWKEWNPFDNE